METAAKGDKITTACVITSEFHGRLNAVRARIPEENRVKTLWHELDKVFTKRDGKLGILRDQGTMRQFRQLPLDRVQDTRVAISRVHDGNARVKIKIAITIQVPKIHALAMMHGKGITSGKRWGSDAFVSRDKALCLWSWWCDVNLWFHGRFIAVVLGIGV